MSIWSVRSNGRRESAIGVSNGAGSRGVLTRLGGIGAVKADAEGGRGGMLGGNAAVAGGRDAPPPPYPGVCVGGGMIAGLAVGGVAGGVTKIIGGPLGPSPTGAGALVGGVTKIIGGPLGPSPTGAGALVGG